MKQVRIWFDSECPLCRREIAVIRRLDRRNRIDFVDLATARDGQCPIDRSELLDRFHAEEDGRIYSGAAAFAAMWRAIPLLRPIGLLARNRAMLWLLERGYRLFLRIRPVMQRAVSRLEERAA